MTWQIHIAHRDPAESLIDAASHCRTLGQDEDRVVTRQLVIQAHIDGVATSAGELIDHIASLEPHQRREMLDNARVECGLESIADVEAGVRAEMASKAGEIVASQYNPQLCHGRTAAGHACNAVGMTDYGVPAATNVRRWFCHEHRDQARPGDMDPLPSPWRYSDVGAIVEVDPVELAREQAAAESRRRQEQAKLEDAAAEAEAAREHQAAIDAQANRELPPHLRAAA